MQAVTKAGFKPGQDVVLALDCASTEFFKAGKYHYEGEGKTRSIDQQVRYLAQLVATYPIVTIEDELTGEAWVSPQAERTLGFSTVRLADVDFWKSRVHPDDQEWVFAVWDHETDEYELEYRMITSDERTIWLRERVVHQLDPERPLDRWLSVGFEITASKELEDQLERARRDDFPVVRPIGIRRPVERPSRTLQRREVSVVVMLGPFEHQMLEQVREPGVAGTLVLGSDVIPEVHRHDRTNRFRHVRQEEDLAGFGVLVDGRLVELAEVEFLPAQVAG